MIRREDVPGAFDRVAFAYDALVEKNPGYDEELRASARMLGPARRILDLGCGTGRSTRALRQAWPGAEIVGLDASEGMLSVARRSLPTTVRLVAGDATDPAAVVKGPFDAIFGAYVLRNLASPDRALAAWRALLGPGGRLVVHDYALDGSQRARWRWHAVALGVVTPLGWLRTRDASLWRYLHRSVLAFDRRDELARRIERAGFRVEQVETSSGWAAGIVHRFGARA